MRLIKLYGKELELILSEMKDLRKNSMVKGYSLDNHPDANFADRHYAVVYTRAKKRDRFPENCVTLCESAEQALEQSLTSEKLYAAEVIGPARSSEGFIIFYLSRWL